MAGRGLALFTSLALAGALASAALSHAQTPLAAPQASPAPDDADRQLVVTTCATCHPITQVTSKTKSPEDWVATVDKMIALGAQVSDEDRERIITYLATHQAPPKS